MKAVRAFPGGHVSGTQLSAPQGSPLRSGVIEHLPTISQKVGLGPQVDLDFDNGCRARARSASSSMVPPACGVRGRGGGGVGVSAVGSLAPHFLAFQCLAGARAGGELPSRLRSTPRGARVRGAVETSSWAYESLSIRHHKIGFLIRFSQESVDGHGISPPSQVMLYGALRDVEEGLGGRGRWSAVGWGAGATGGGGAASSMIAV